MVKSMLGGMVILAIALGACTQKDGNDSTSAMCLALDDGDKALAATLIDPIAKQQSSADWKANIDMVILWLEEQDCVKDAHSEYPIIETLPVQTEIVVKLESGPTEILDLYLDEQTGAIWVNQFH